MDETPPEAYDDFSETPKPEAPAGPPPVPSPLGPLPEARRSRPLPMFDPADASAPTRGGIRFFAEAQAQGRGGSTPSEMSEFYSVIGWVLSFALYWIVSGVALALAALVATMFFGDMQEQSWSLLGQMAVMGPCSGVLFDLSLVQSSNDLFVGAGLIVIEIVVLLAFLCAGDARGRWQACLLAVGLAIIKITILYSSPGAY